MGIMLNQQEQLPKAVLRAWRSARQRARRCGVPFKLTLDQLFVLWERCDHRCAASGLKFTEERIETALVKRPFAPSIDQIEATKGYTLENARITCVAANFAMNQWGLVVLRRLARGVVQHEREERNETKAWRRRQQAKLHEAQRAALSMRGPQLITQRHRIAGLKAALTLGPLTLSEAAPARTRRESFAASASGR
jgi:hypothetical protein